MSSLAKGLGVLQWGASFEEVMVRLPHARLRAGVKGKNPATGVEFVIPPGLEILDFVEPSPGVKVKASLDFEDGGLCLISLATRCHAEPTDDPAMLRMTEQLVLQEAQLLADYLRVGPVSSGQAVQGWEVDGVDVTLYIDCDDFEFELSKNGD